MCEVEELFWVVSMLVSLFDCLFVVFFFKVLDECVSGKWVGCMLGVYCFVLLIV